ncbi:cupin domain-containing protein [Lolliginicoccus levis]|uniref:cupin domain-containing protein n=1 Tax=Lolliginicoccus levis TaxID=2919542 RepID=UPI00241D7086|nr:cupin domain-containing protein [Lolliginicoccus levis]
MKFSTRAASLAAGAALALTAFGGVAGASPSSGVESQEVGAFEVPFSVWGGMGNTTGFSFRMIEIDPGGYTGWHWHENPVYGYVASGTLTRIYSDCAERVDSMGSFIEEVPGEGASHVGINRGDGPLVLYVLYASSDGGPTTVSVDDPGCGVE